MWRTLAIDENDWQQAPTTVQTVLISLRHEAHPARLRAIGYHRQIDLLNQPAARFLSLQNQIAVQRKLILGLQQQIAQTTELSAQVTKLTAENAEMREKLGPNSTNSSCPPSSDPPFRQATKLTQTTGQPQGAQIRHRGRRRLLADDTLLTKIVALHSEIFRRCGGSQFEPVD